MSSSTSSSSLPGAASVGTSAGKGSGDTSNAGRDNATQTCRVQVSSDHTNVIHTLFVHINFSVGYLIRQLTTNHVR